MKTVKTLCLLFVPALLAGCYAQVEDQNVSLIHNLCTPKASTCLTGGGITLALDDLRALIPPFELDLGDSLATVPTSAGPATLENELRLKRITVTMLSDGDFSGISYVELRAAINNDSCAAVSANCVLLAKYDRTTDGPADKTFTAQSDVNLIDIAGKTHVLQLYVAAVGTGPTVLTWTGTVELQMSMKSRGSFP